MVSIKCKFGEILPKLENTLLLNDYNNLILRLEEKSKNKMQIKLEKEIYEIFEINENNIIDCSLFKVGDKMFRIQITFISCKKKDYFFIKEPYDFKLGEIEYIGFEASSLMEFLKREQNKKQFKIHQKNSVELTDSIEFFISLEISKFDIVFDYKYRNISSDKFEPTNIYAKKDKYLAEDINFYFPFYIDLNENDFKNFEYYDTRERKEFMKIMKFYIHNINFNAICGSFGSGKTVTLLKFIISNIRYRFFYINLWMTSTFYIEEVKNILKYECVKLFGKNINALKDSDEEKNMKEILALIGNLKDKTEIFDLINKIISLLKNIKKTFIIIIDQYSSKYDSKNKNIKIIQSSIEDSNIKILVCSSMNNEDVKYNLSRSFKIPRYTTDCISYFYIGCLIKTKSTDITNKTVKFQRNLYKFGNLMFYYYLLEENENNPYFIEKEEKRIKNEIENFYLEEYHSNKEKMISDILQILYIVNEKEIIFYDDLDKLILKLPMKFLQIKKQKINIINLKNYIKEKNNNDLKNKLNHFLNRYDIEIIKDISRVNSYFYNSIQVIQFQNMKLSYYQKKKLDNQEDDIYIFFLDYLFPYIQEILTNIMYTEIIKYGKLLFPKFVGRTKGGFLEYFIIEFIKDRKKFYDYDIRDFESIETLVDNNYYIQNHSSRLIPTKKKYQIKNRNISTKIKLPKKNILLTQNQFTGKYYDCSILIPLSEDENDKNFLIIVFQISKIKIASHRYYKEEHELILGDVKRNVESEFDINISKGYFCYIFSSKKMDKSSIEFCNKFQLSYIFFLNDKMKFDPKIPFKLDDSLITSKFPFQNTFTILPKKKFEKIRNSDELANYTELRNIGKNFIYEKLSIENEKKLNKYFYFENIKNEYILLDYFDKRFEVTDKCFWYDNKDKIVFYKNNTKENEIKLDLDFKENEPKRFILIAHKYKLFINSNDLFKNQK